MIKNIIFDLGRVLVNFEPIEYIKNFNFDEKTNSQLANIIFYSDIWIECDKGKYNNTEIVDILINKYPKLENQIKLVLTKDWVKLLTLKEDSINYLKSLKNRGFHIYILSNLSRESYDYISMYEFFKLVDGSVYSYEEKICKPDLDIFNILIQKYNLNVRDTIFIDDNLDNINASKILEINGVLFDNIYNVQKQVEDIINYNLISI